MQTDVPTKRFYEHLTPQAVQPLSDFRTRYPYQSLEMNGITWRYIDSQRGDPVLLLLAGGTTVAEVSYNSITRFGDRFRVLAPDYPPIPDMDAFCAELNRFLDRLGVSRVNLMGGSYGGWIAQSYVRHSQQRVNKLVITSVGAPDIENGKRLARMMPIFRILPVSLLRRLLTRSFSRLDSGSEENPELALLFALVNEVMYTRVAKKDILAALRRLIDQTQNHSFSPDDLYDWEGKIIWVFGEDDPAVKPETRERMLALYPGIETAQISGGEHAVSITHGDQYYRAIENFLAE